MELLSVGFGVVTIIAFVYAVITQRRAESYRVLTNRLTREMETIASKIAGLNRGTATEGYAESLKTICNSILGEDVVILDPAHLTVAYSPSDLPPLRTFCGEIVPDPLSRHARALSGRLEEPIPAEVLNAVDAPALVRSPVRAFLVYGPYQGLPLAGRWRVRFRLRVDDTSRFPDDAAIVRLDIVDVEANRVFGHKAVRVSSLSTSRYATQVMEFEYDHRSPRLEFRVMLLRVDVTVFFEEIVASLST